MLARILRGVSLSFLLLLGGCSTPEDDSSEHPSKAIDPDYVPPALATISVLQLSSWLEAFNQPLTERVGATSEEVISFLQNENEAAGIAEKPYAADVSSDFLKEVQGAIRSLPQEVRSSVGQYCAGIYFVYNLGSTGFTQEIVDLDNRPVAAFIALDPQRLKRTGNEWISWRDSTPYLENGPYTIESTIERVDLESTRQAAIQYILLHEFGHIIGLCERGHPPWGLDPTVQGINLEDYPFMDLSWEVRSEGSGYISRAATSFPDLYDLQLYAPPEDRVSNTFIPVAYRWLRRTNFASVYAASSPFEDFAESYASYVHSVMMGNPYKITIKNQKDELLVIDGIWDSPRMAEKRHYFDQKFKQ